MVGRRVGWFAEVIIGGVGVTVCLGCEWVYSVEGRVRWVSEGVYRWRVGSVVCIGEVEYM